jgi:hypothetical protein
MKKISLIMILLMIIISTIGFSDMTVYSPISDQQRTDYIEINFTIENELCEGTVVFDGYFGCLDGSLSDISFNPSIACIDLPANYFYNLSLINGGEDDLTQCTNGELYLHLQYYEDATEQDFEYNLNMYYNITEEESDTTNPNIEFLSPTEINNSYINRNYIQINSSANDTNFANQTIYLYNETVLLDSYYSENESTFVNFTNYQLYFETGETWTQMISDLEQVKSTISGNGSKIILSLFSKIPKISNNYGITFNNLSNLSSDSWYDVDMSNDGNYIYIGNDEYIYKSSDGGETFEVLNVENRNWYNIRCSDDGSKIIAQGSGSNPIFLSLNYGLNWTQQTGIDNRISYAVDVSGDGSLFLVGVDNGKVYVSTDNGTTWNVKVTYGEIFGFATSYNGSFIVVGSNTNLSYSEDYGENWNYFGVTGRYVTMSNNTQTIFTKGKKSIDRGVTWTDISLTNENSINLHTDNNAETLIATNYEFAYVSKQGFVSYDLSDGIYYFNATAYDTSGNYNTTETRQVTIDTTFPSTINNLNATIITNNSIYWEWINPTDLDFNYSIIYLDDIFVLNTSNNYYNATNLDIETNYTIKINTIDLSGNINTTNIIDKVSTYPNINLTYIVEDTGEIIFSQVNIFGDISSYITISNNFIEITNPILNVPANITLYNLPYFENPVVIHNGIIDTNQEQYNLNYNSDTRIATFYVSSWSNYSLGNVDIATPCQNTQGTIYIAFGLIALILVVGSGILIVKAFDGGVDATIIITSIIGMIGLSIVLFVGYYIIFVVGQSVCL